GIDPPDSIVGAGLPDNQSRVFCFHQLNEGGGDLLGGLATLYFYGEIDRNRPELVLEHRQKPRRIGAGLLRGDGRRTAAYYQDVRGLAVLGGGGVVGRGAAAAEQGGGDAAGRRGVFRGASCRSGKRAGEQDRAQDGGPHRPPPAISALPM